MWDERQYGFRKATGTIEALGNLTEKMERNKREGLHTLVIALDLENAFNTATENEVIKELLEKKAYRRLVRMCGSFMEDRKVKSEGIKVDVYKGCPQGSSLGPTLWLVNMNRWCRKMNILKNEMLREINVDKGEEEYWDRSESINIQAYADDQVILMTAR